MTNSPLFCRSWHTPWRNYGGLPGPILCSPERRHRLRPCHRPRIGRSVHRPRVTCVESQLSSQPYPGTSGSDPSLRERRVGRECPHIQASSALYSVRKVRKTSLVARWLQKTRVSPECPSPENRCKCNRAFCFCQSRIEIRIQSVSMRNEIGNAIRRLRQSHGLTQEELGTLAQVSQQTLSDAETGQSKPSLDTLCQVAAAMNLTPDTIFIEAGLLGVPKSIKERQARYMDAKLNRLLAIANGLDQKHRVLLIEMAAALLRHCEHQE